MEFQFNSQWYSSLRLHLRLRLRRCIVLSQLFTLSSPLLSFEFPILLRHVSYLLQSSSFLFLRTVPTIILPLLHNSPLFLLSLLLLLRNKRIPLPLLPCPSIHIPNLLTFFPTT